MSALLVYAVIRASHRDPSAKGVRLVPDHGLVAVVREIEDDAVLNDEDAHAYLDALIALLPGGPVVPVQFGTVAPSEDAVREEMLHDAAEELERCLDRLEGKVELRLRIEASSEAEIEKLLQSSPDIRRAVRARAGDETLDFRVELGRRTSLLLAERRDELRDHVLSRLGNHAEAHAFLTSDSVTELHLAYLVRADKLGAFDGAVSALREELGGTYEIEYVGPLPAFDFTDVDLDPHEERPRWGWS